MIAQGSDSPKLRLDGTKRHQHNLAAVVNIATAVQSR